MHQKNQATAIILEQMGNRLLSLDSEAHAKLHQFSNKIIQISITDLDLNYFFIFPGGNLVVKSHLEKQPSALISGRLSAFLAAVSAKSASDTIFNGELHFSGEVSTAHQFQSLAQSLKIDWEEPLARIFGDVIGHTITSNLKKIGQFTLSLLNNLRLDIPEYLQEELRVSPSEYELDDYYEQVDIVRSQSDRLQARIKQLIQNLQSNSH